MKNSLKKVVLIFTVACMIASLCACSKNENNTSEQDAVSTNAEVKEDYMYKYLKKLPSDAERKDFLSFWNSMVSYCMSIEIELRNINNENTFEFDPMNDATYPENIKDLYSFSELQYFNGFSSHKNFKLSIDGENVELSFDGEKFYPTTYGYSEIEEIVDSLKSE